MTATKTPEQLERAQLDILNELADKQARLADAERANADTVEWEYSIAYPDGERWNPDGAEILDTLAEAEEEFNTFRDAFLSGDRIVRRRKAGPWEPVSHVSEEER
jgi:hypothetical protein